MARHKMIHPKNRVHISEKQDQNYRKNYLLCLAGYRDIFFLL